MARILVTGSTDGVGRATAASLLDDGHDVVVHARNQQRLGAVEELIARGAVSVVGDLADADEVEGVAEQANQIGAFDAVIHNAGVIDGPDMLQVNMLAPYVLTAQIPAPRLVYLSSSMHRGGHAEVSRIDENGTRASYSDSKLFVTALMAAVARRWPGRVAHAVDPGWVPTRMGGPSASDDLALAHVTQAWLVTTEDPEALVSGRYWHHQRVEQPHPAVHDEGFQDDLLAALAEHTGVELPNTDQSA
ncbi:SDR family NAD(P)-dependent oxidoreductase [Microbacterium sp. Sa4CUA7]|uniref:SDR family NAD(P)-dependent oxidoreductase n=1 Tax=Microbacterium pullorum TaxID=2762236 RepID=A0ABR8RYW3_9MICO|nr:SDR family NAD(P)-dependent oxidoreductase [Microbacterium pullorum]MBD7956441.1 SDR family NAD(P)-dependent oxidoreductase [Microbacterium pullorum]